MKLTDLHEKEEEKTEGGGTYAAVNFCEDSINSLVQFTKDNNIPNPLMADKFHCTVMYSRKDVPDFESLNEIDPSWTATHKNFDVWETQPDDEGNTRNVLVMLLECPELVDRFNYIMDNYGASYDFDEYKPHVSLSYDVGDYDVAQLKWPNDTPLNVVSEYSEPLN